MKTTNVASAFLLILLLTFTHAVNSQEAVYPEKLTIPGLFDCAIPHFWEKAPLTLVLYHRNDADSLLRSWQKTLESFKRRGVLVLLLTENEQLNANREVTVNQLAEAACLLSSIQNFLAANNLPPWDQYAILLDETKTIIALAETEQTDAQAKFINAVVQRTPNDLRTLRFVDPPTPL